MDSVATSVSSTSASQSEVVFFAIVDVLTRCTAFPNALSQALIPLCQRSVTVSVTVTVTVSISVTVTVSVTVIVTVFVSVTVIVILIGCAETDGPITGNITGSFRIVLVANTA